MGVRKNKSEGDIFEELFLKQAQRNGLLPIKNPLSARHTYSGRVQLLKSDLDYKLISQSGRVGFFDCKSFQGAHFDHSAIEPDQIKRAATYNYWNVPSGFVVWFRGINVISFFTGAQIATKGPRTSFRPPEGQILGKFDGFDLKRLLGG